MSSDVGLTYSGQTVSDLIGVDVQNVLKVSVTDHLLQVSACLKIGTGRVLIAKMDRGTRSKTGPVDPRIES